MAVVLLCGVTGCGGGGADLVPAFQDAGIADKTYVQNLPADSETLPAGAGGDGMLTYVISPDLPAGLTFDPETRLLSGTPAVPQPATLYTYTATDSDTRGPDSASLTFTIAVEADLVPAFQGAGIADKTYVQNLPADSETLPAATSGDGALTYAITPQLPAGLTFDPATRLLSGTPAAPQTATLYTYTVTDSDQAGPDSASLTFTVMVMQDLAPTFEQAGITDKTYTRGLTIDGETLPAASGGDGMLTYSISPVLPAGLTFDPATRLLSGTPAAQQGAALYTYTATDSDAANPDSASLTFAIRVQAIASVTLSAGAGEMDEGDDRTPVVVTLNLSEPVLDDIAVTLAATGTAQLGSDFDLAATEVTVAAGAIQATTTLTPIRDLEAESDETVTLEIVRIAGPGEIGPAAAVEIVIRDLGAPPPDDYAALDVLTFLDGGEPYNIGADELHLSYLVRNTGRVAASATRAVLFTTTDLFSDADPLRRLAGRPVPALGPNDSRFYDTVRVPFDALVPGANNYLLIYVVPVPEEDPEVAGYAYGFDAVHLTHDGRIPVSCAGFERTAEPGAPDPLFAHQWALDNTGQKAFAEEAGVAGEDLNMGQTLFGGPTGAGVQVAVVDTGLEVCHPDLAPNVEPGLSHNFNAAIWLDAHGDDPFLPTVLGDHGTSVAGLIAAAAENGIGGRGVAPQARLRGFNFLEGQFQPGALFDALGMSDESPRSSDAHIFNMSFGAVGAAGDATADERELFRAGVYDLRDGLGAVYVKAAGNSFNRCTKEDEDGQPAAPRLDLSAELGCFTASNGHNNLPYLIVTGAFSADGRRSSYSSGGPPPGGGGPPGGLSPGPAGQKNTAPKGGAPGD
ncbi:MAG: putative Ig domain-containing protein, partial [Candidatus Tectomicrobia bacterium]|nr:putative Ig domain-containing protein [Candidatus Tectomicrobia bacterium]